MNRISLGTSVDYFFLVFTPFLSTSSSLFAIDRLFFFLSTCIYSASLVSSIEFILAPSMTVYGCPLVREVLFFLHGSC